MTKILTTVNTYTKLQQIQRTGLTVTKYLASAAG